MCIVNCYFATPIREELEKGVTGKKRAKPRLLSHNFVINVNLRRRTMQFWHVVSFVVIAIVLIMHEKTYKLTLITKQLSRLRKLTLLNILPDVLVTGIDKSKHDNFKVFSLVFGIVFSPFKLKSGYFLFVVTMNFDSCMFANCCFHKIFDIFLNLYERFLFF